MKRFILISLFLFGAFGALVADEVVAHPEQGKPQEGAFLARHGHNKVRVDPGNVYIVCRRLIVSYRGKKGLHEIKALREDKKGLYFLKKDIVIRGVGKKNYYKQKIATKGGGHHRHSTPASQRSPLIYRTPDGGIIFRDDPVTIGHPEHRYHGEDVRRPDYTIWGG